MKHQESLQLDPQELSVLDGHQDVGHLEVLGMLKNLRFLTERNLAVLEAANFKNFQFLRPRDFLKENLKVSQNDLFKLLYTNIDMLKCSGKSESDFN